MADDRKEAAEQVAQRGVDEQGGAALARALLRDEGLAVLATTSVRTPGHPFASLVPFAVAATGEPLLLLSALAQHTQNLEADPRACLLVHDAAAAARDPRTAARAALVGRVRRVRPDEEEDARARYLARHPAARGLLGLDFALRILAVEELQIVGGFASAGWFPGAELREPA